MESMNYAQAVNEALRRALTEMPETIFYGEDVGKPGGVYGCSRKLYADFGADRVFDTPISEGAMIGAAVGAAMTGLRPIVEIMFVDFTLVAMDQIVNQAANIRYVSGGRLTAPLTIRTQQGAMLGACAQHSQSLEAMFAHVPGLRVAVSATAQDAYSLLLSAITCNDPTIVIESRILYHGDKQDVETGGEIEPIGLAKIAHPGDDVTIVTWGTMLFKALAAAEQLASEGISAEVINARWIAPFDWETLFSSVAKTGRLLIVHEANSTAGFGAEIAARTYEAMGDRLKRPVARLAVPDVRMPAAPHLQRALVPDPSNIADKVRSLMQVS